MSDPYPGDPPLPKPEDIAIPTDAEIKEIEEKISAALKAKADGDPPAEHRLKQEAIALADKYYKIPRGDLHEPIYVHGEHGEAARTFDADDIKDSSTLPGEIRVEIYDGAFVYDGKPSAAWLASTKIHELMGHCLMLKMKAAGKKACIRPLQDVYCFNLELHLRERTKLTDAMIEQIKKLKAAKLANGYPERKEYWKKLEPWLENYMAQSGYPRIGTDHAGLLAVFALFQVPDGVIVNGEEGPVEVPGNGVIVRDLAQRLTGEDIGRFLFLNPHLAVSASDLARVFQGPEGGAPSRDNDLEQASDHVVLNSPRLGPSGLLLDADPSPASS